VPPLFLQVVQILGGLVLLYLAYGSFNAARHYQEAVASPAPVRATFARAVLVNLFNPNPYVAWTLILGPLLLGAWREAAARGVALVAGFYLTMVLGTAAIVMLLAAARSLGTRVARALVGVSAVALAVFGLYLLWSGAHAGATAARLP
jgi:threonine/homoserine/homoserine lactone efflux protein